MPEEDKTQEEKAAKSGSASSQNDANELSPKALHDRLEQIVRETEGLRSYLEDAIKKGGEQLRAIKAFDEKAAQAGGGVEQIDTKGIDASMEDIRGHITSLEEVHERVKGDLNKVEQISEKISEILGKYE